MCNCSGGGVGLLREMAMRLGITPTFHLSCRLRLLRLEALRQSSTSYSCLARQPIPKCLQVHSGSNFPRLGLWRRSVVAVSSGPSGEGDDEAPRKKRYDLSTGFLESRRSSEKFGLRNLAKDDDNGDGEDWESTFTKKTVAGDYSNRDYRFRDSTRAAVLSSEEDEEEDEDEDGAEFRRQPTSSRGFRSSRSPSSRGIRSSRENEDVDGEVGGWMGNAEPSESFKKSSLYNARSVRYSQLPPASGVSGYAPMSSRPAHERTNPKPRKQPQVNSASSLAPPSEPPKVRVVSGDATLADFMPQVIKPEQPYIYSYSETPKVAPLGFREPVYSPFGPEGVSRPWTGRPPLEKSKKKPREFDSFNPPPVGKKGVKPVQQPGPFPEGEGPKLGRSREEIMGPPLTDGEVKELILRAQKENRQLNLGECLNPKP